MEWAAFEASRASCVRRSPIESPKFLLETAHGRFAARLYHCGITLDLDDQRQTLQRPSQRRSAGQTGWDVGLSLACSHFFDKVDELIIVFYVTSTLTVLEYGSQRHSLLLLDSRSTRLLAI
jgi:hypothetical protein